MILMKVKPKYWGAFFRCVLFCGLIFSWVTGWQFGNRMVLQGIFLMFLIDWYRTKKEERERKKLAEEEKQNNTHAKD